MAANSCTQGHGIAHGAVAAASDSISARAAAWNGISVRCAYTSKLVSTATTINFVTYRVPVRILEFGRQAISLEWPDAQIGGRFARARAQGQVQTLFDQRFLGCAVTLRHPSCTGEQLIWQLDSGFHMGHPYHEYGEYGTPDSA